MSDKNTKELRYGKVKITIGSKLRVMIGIRIFLVEVKDIDPYSNIIAEDILGNPLIFKPKNCKFINVLTEEQWAELKKRYA